MRIKVRSTDANFSLWLPSRVIFSGATARLAGWAIRKYTPTASQHMQASLTTPQLRQLFKAVRRCRKHFKHQPLIDVHAADGTKVEIWL